MINYVSDVCDDNVCNDDEDGDRDDDEGGDRDDEQEHLGADDEAPAGLQVANEEAGTGVCRQCHQ